MKLTQISLMSLFETSEIQRMLERMDSVPDLEKKLAIELNSRFQDEDAISCTVLQLCKALNGMS